MASEGSISGTLDVDGFELPYRSEGSGRDVLIAGDTIYYPRTFSAALRRHLRLIFASHRGFGRAARPFTNADFELDTLADDFERLRRHLNLGQVVILGHSGHGHMALAYARRYPQHVSHIVIVAMSPDSSPASFRAADRYLEDSVCPERKAALAENLARMPAEIEANPDKRFIIYSLRSGPRIWYDHTYDASALWQGVQVIPEMFDYVWGQRLPQIDITEGLERITMPVFLGLGRYDYWNPPHLWEGVRERFHNLRIRVFEQSGHTPQLEQPDAFDRELLAWLNETSEASVP